MTTNVISPGLGVLSDDEETPVFESTAADCAVGIRKDLLSDFSVISPGLGHRSQLISDEGSEKVLVYVRIRPFVEGEREKKEDQGCVVVENQETLLLRAPKESFTMKNMERGMGQSIHKFTFSQIFGPEADQKQFFDGTMRRVVKDVLNGQNWLVYTYGVTNSGKTYTIQGNARDGGILPRSVSLIFNSSHERLYKSSDLKPLSNEVMWLDSKQVRQEELKKLSLLSNLREEELFIPVKNGSDSPHRPGTSLSYDSGIGGLSSTSHVTHTSSHLEESCSRLAYQDAVSMEEPLNVQLSIWVSYFEIYNEFVYDLLEPIPSGPNRKRTTLRLCEDRSGNPYVKDLNWINVHSAEEAWKIIRVGRKNQSFASTHLNQNSSRSHSIFSIRILHLQGNHDLAPKISELSFCDLAGSERCKDQQRGDRLKEATNINTSLHTLGRCIAALRQNQQQKLRQNVVPFRDSKLTRVFQTYFTGRGRSCMIVNINQCASTYDETLHAMKFSAIASQLVQAPITKMNIPSLHSLMKENGMLSNRTCAEDEDSEDLSDGESDDEADITMFNREELLQVVEGLKQLLLKERQEQFNLEMNIRKEVCDEMTEMMQQQKSQHSDQLEDGKALLEDLYDQRMENLKESFSNYYKRELEERDERIEELETALEESKCDTLASVPVTRDSVPLRRSKRLATNDGPEMDRLKQELLSLKAELQASHEEIERNKKMQEPPVSAKPFTTDVDRKILEGQKNVRLLREELQKFGNSLQQVDRACCHTTGSERLRQALVNCDEILSKQEKTLAELQNNMVLVKMDLKKKAVCIAEQYNTVQKLQISTRGFKRTCNNENIQPIQSTEKRPFLRNLLSRTPGQKALTETGPYSRVLRARRSPVLKTIAFGTKF